MNPQTRANALPTVAAVTLALLAACSHESSRLTEPVAAVTTLEQGKQTFRFDTFGDESFWTGTLRMHEVIAAAVDPTTALSVGLKVDAEALPAAVVQGIKDGSISLKSPATTVALLKLNAVVGLKGTVESINGKDTLTRVGVTCALCHSTVDNSFAPGIGKRLDGWANRDLNPGAIIALSPALPAATKAVYNSWGKGRYDPRFNLDGKNGPQVIPPAYGLKSMHRITSTGDGADLAYWNRYVAVTQMGGHGSFSEPRTGVKVTNGTDDQVSGKLAGTPVLSAQPRCACRTSGQLRRRRGGPRQGRLQRHRQMRDVPFRRRFHRWQPALASRLRGRERTGNQRRPELRIAQRDQAVPYSAVARVVAARALFPQRLRGHSQGRGGDIQRAPAPGA
jgi:hypothetical protein